MSRKTSHNLWVIDLTSEVTGWHEILKETVHLQKNIKQSIFKQILYLKCEE